MHALKKIMEKKGMVLGLKITVACALLVSIVALQGCKHYFKQEHHFDMNDALKAEQVIPVAIIGSGPAGLTAAIYSARGLVSTVVFEGSTPGGLLTKTTDVENWPGNRIIKGPDLIDNIRSQVVDLGVQIVSDSIVSIDCSVWPFVLTTESGLTVRALTVIIATGASPRLLNIPGESDYWGYGVTSCAVCDAPFFKGEDVIVVGGGDSAVEESLQAAQWVNKVTTLVRGDRMRAAASGQKRLEAYASINVLYNKVIEEIQGESYMRSPILEVHNDPHNLLAGTENMQEEVPSKRVTGVKIRDLKTGEVTVINARAVFLAIGHIPNSDLFKNCVAIDKNGYIELKSGTQATSQPGVFAAGEVEDDHYRQAIVSAGNGARAGLDALAFLREIGYSTDIAKQMNLWSPGLRGTGSVELGTIGSLAEFEKVSGEAKELLVLDFNTENCPACKQLEPLLRELANDYRDKTRFFTIDANAAKDLAEKYFVYKVPCLLLFKDGQLRARYMPRPDQSGVIHKEEISGLIEQGLLGEEHASNK